MAKTTAAEPSRSAELAPELIRLANRITLLTFFTAFVTVVGLTLLPRVFSQAPFLLRLAATLPLLVAIGTVLYVRRLRTELRALRQAGAEPPSAPLTRSPAQRALRSPRPPAPEPREPRTSPPERSHGLEG